MGKQKHFQASLILCIIVFIISLMTVSSWGTFYDDQGTSRELTIGDKNKLGVAPFFYATLDAAGYSDWIWYGPSPQHEQGYHELLSGEWGAAVYYNGIATDNQQAMWLTQQFSFPDWKTGCNFLFGGTCYAEADPNENPVPLYDTGKSVIYNGQLTVTIDYEVVDLEYRDPNIYDPNLYPNRSPICYLDELTGQPRYVRSDRYCFLQTFTFKNTEPNLATLANLEFYIFHHSHGADEYRGYVNSTYSTLAPDDPLEDYTPYNPIHTTGNFRYDLTQWNGPRYGTAGHTDYVSVSSVNEPNWIDNDVYEGGHWYAITGGWYKPPKGTHIHIEERDLNGVSAVYEQEVGGAMGWGLGILEPGQEKSITLAYMFGPKEEPTELLELTKTIIDPNACYSPGEQLTFTLEWENKSPNPIADAILVDYLPKGLIVPVTYAFDPNTLTVTSSDPNYTEGSNTYRWDIGTIPAYGSDSRELTVMVTEKAEPGMPLRNRAVLSTAAGDVSATYDVPICCWDSGIIYVDPTATGDNIGTSWTDAYTDFQRAMERAAAGCGNEIYIAQGVYDPGRKGDETFTIPDNVSVYGGFKKGGCAFSERNPDRYPTILTGAAETEHNGTVVTMGDNTLMDGFTITGSAYLGYGIYSYDADFTLKNSLIIDNVGYGIYAENGDVGIQWCMIKNNGLHGVEHRGEGYLLNIENCQIIKNNRYGIFCSNSIPTIKDSIISCNGFSGNGYQGIAFLLPLEAPVLYNNTIVYNKLQGLLAINNNPNDPNLPDIQNCILWYNNSDSGIQTAGFDANSLPRYCCIYDPITDPNGIDYTLKTNDNFSGNPGFAYSDPNNLHLAYDSPCKNMGSPYHTTDDVGLYDMDGEDRIISTRVDIGADEVYACRDLGNEDIYNALDWNADGLVNYEEFADFSRAWLSCEPNFPGDPNNWNPVCNLDKTGDSEHKIDLADLEIFISDTPWLWRACWKQSQMDGFETLYYSMMTESMFFESSAVSLDSYESGIEVVKISELNTIEKSIVQILTMVEKDIQEGTEHPNIEGLTEIKAFLEGCLVDIRSRK